MLSNKKRQLEVAFLVVGSENLGQPEAQLPTPNNQGHLDPRLTNRALHATK